MADPSFRFAAAKPRYPQPPPNMVLYSKNRMKQILSLIFVVVLIIGCDSKPPIELTTEQAVYESLFLEITGDTHTKYYVADATENDWFKDNPFQNEKWEKALDDLGGINIELVKMLYDINKNSSPINWTPIITNAELLPSEYVIGVDPHTTGERCLVNRDEANIDIMQNNKYMRSYYTISKVAFSQDRKTAILKFSRHCAPMSGAGEFFVAFKFEEKRWQMIGSRMLWIS